MNTNPCNNCKHPRKLKKKQKTFLTKLNCLAETWEHATRRTHKLQRSPLIVERKGKESKLD